MPAKQHLNFHGTVSTFVCQFHPSLTALVLNLPTPSTPQTVLSTTRERSMLTRRESRWKVSLFSLVICVSSRAIVSNSFVCVALRRVNARNTARLISVTLAFSTAFTSVSWVRAAWLCNSAAVSSLPKGVTDVAFSSICRVPCCCS